MQKEEEQASSETQSTQSGRENWREEHGRKSPWVLTLTRPFPKPKANAGSWLGTKKCFISPNRRTAYVKFFSCIRTRRLLTHHWFVHQGCASKETFISTSLARNEGTTYDSRKHFGCYQQKPSNLHRETFLRAFSLDPTDWAWVSED